MLSSIKNKLEEALDTVQGKSDVAKKLKQYTTNDPWQATSTQLMELCEASYDWIAYEEMMPMILERLQLQPKQWRIIYKAIVIIDYLLRYGHPRVLDWCKSYNHLTLIQRLQNFTYVDETARHHTDREKGEGIRTRAYIVCQWLEKPAELQRVREEAQKNRQNYLGVDASGRQRALSDSTVDHTFPPTFAALNNSYPNPSQYYSNQQHPQYNQQHPQQQYSQHPNPQSDALFPSPNFMGYNAPQHDMMQPRKYSAEHVDQPRNFSNTVPNSFTMDGRYRSNSVTLPAREANIRALQTPPSTLSIPRAPLRQSPNASPSIRPIPVAPLRSQTLATNTPPAATPLATPAPKENPPHKEIDLFGLDDSKSSNASQNGAKREDKSAFDMLSASMH